MGGNREYIELRTTFSGQLPLKNDLNVTRDRQKIYSPTGAALCKHSWLVLIFMVHDFYIFTGTDFNNTQSLNEAKHVRIWKNLHSQNRKIYLVRIFQTLNSRHNTTRICLELIRDTIFQSWLVKKSSPNKNKCSEQFVLKKLRQSRLSFRKNFGYKKGFQR